MTFSAVRKSDFFNYKDLETDKTGAKGFFFSFLSKTIRPKDFTALLRSLIQKLRSQNVSKAL